MDPSAIANAAMQAMNGSTGPPSELEQRARIGRLNFAAAMYAEKSDCDCDGCQYLRKAGEIMLGDVEDELKSERVTNRAERRKK
jgi:hypothetical protein